MPLPYTRQLYMFQPTHQPEFDLHPMQPPLVDLRSKRTFSGQAVAKQGDLVQTKHKLPVMHRNCNNCPTLFGTKCVRYSSEPNAMKQLIINTLMPHTTG